MLSLDKALSLYTDKILCGEGMGIEAMSKFVLEDVREEFEELAQFIELTTIVKETEDFTRFFDKLNGFKEEYYNFDAVANFHSEKGADRDTELIDKLFEEEFGDED